MTDSIDYFDVPEIEPEEKTLETLVRLAQESSDLEAEILQEQIETEKKIKRRDEINRNRIPEIMSELGMKSLRLEDGSELIVEDKVKASIPAAKKEDAYAWLDDHGFGGLIKTKLISDFDRVDREKAEVARKLLAENGYTVAVESSIHPATLLSFVKEQLAEAGNKEQTDSFGVEDSEQNAPIPMNIFSVFEFKEAKIKAPKKKPSKK